MADNTNPGLLTSLWRFFTFYKLRKSMAINRAANAQFTKSADGVSDAYDLKHDNLVGDFNTLMGAVKQVATAIEQKRSQKEAIEKNLKTEHAALDGATNAILQYETSDPAKSAEAQHDAERFQANVTRFEAQIKALDQSIKDNEPELTKLKERLTDIKDRIGQLPMDKANAIAQFISDDAIIEANKTLMGLHSSQEVDPTTAVEDALRAKHAEAKVSGEIAGTDADSKRNAYIKNADASTAGEGVAAILAAKRAQRDAKAGESKPVERQQI